MAKQTPACVGSDSGLQFPLYLLPPIPFLRKPKPNSSDAAELKRQQAAAKLKRKKYGKDAGESEVWAEEKVLNGHAQYLKCRKCQSFMGRHGRAYLLSHLETPRIVLSKSISRPLVTGMHTVSDISCALCTTTLGWKYINAEEEDQRYKIGKYILERERVVKVNHWDGEDGEGVKPQGKEEEVEVDSQDEDELEDMFLGVWTKETALKRRKSKAERKAGKGS